MIHWIECLECNFLFRETFLNNLSNNFLCPNCRNERDRKMIIHDAQGEFKQCQCPHCNYHFIAKAFTGEVITCPQCKYGDGSHQTQETSSLPSGSIAKLKTEHGVLTFEEAARAAFKTHGLDYDKREEKPDEELSVPKFHWKEYAVIIAEKTKKELKEIIEKTNAEPAIVVPTIEFENMPFGQMFEVPTYAKKVVRSYKDISDAAFKNFKKQTYSALDGPGGDSVMIPGKGKDVD